MEGVLTISLVIAFVIGCFWFVDFVRVHSLRYLLDESGLAFVGVLGGQTPIPYGQIESARVISWIDYLRLRTRFNFFKTRDYTTRTLTQKFVVVRRRDGRAFIITPDNPEEFVATLKDKIVAAAA